MSQSAAGPLHLHRPLLRSLLSQASTHVETGEREHTHVIRVDISNKKMFMPYFFMFKKVWHAKHSVGILLVWKTYLISLF